MFSRKIRQVDLGDGNTWGVEYGTPEYFEIRRPQSREDKAIVIIPVGQTLSMSDGEILCHFREVQMHALRIAALESTREIIEVIEYYNASDLKYELEYLSRFTIIEDSVTLELMHLMDVIRERINHLDRINYVAAIDSLKARRARFDKKRDKLLIKIAERDGFICVKCGEAKNLTVDHVIPLSCGGGNDLDNLQILCKRCNSSKGSRL